MNRILKTWISLLIALTMVTSIWGYSQINSVQYALADPLNAVIHDESDLYLDTFASKYFINLKDNAAYNKASSCGYVAIASLLSFYDTYWNDNIIPEIYDQTSNSLSVSPGVKNEYAAFQDMTDAQYISATYDDDNINTYFQFLLFELRREATGQSTMSSFGVTYSKMCAMIDYYLFEYLNLSTRVCSVYTVNTNVEAFVKQYVIQGTPVIVGIPGHVTVAYDYDEEQDKLYGYWGWREFNNHAPYTTFSDAYAIVLSMNHVHSNNYILNNEAVCSCHLSSHVHNFNYGEGVSGHTGTCFCEQTECGGTFFKLYYSDTQHRVNCSCGYTGFEYHTFDASQSYYEGLTLYNNCLGCGARINMNSGFGGGL